MIDIFLISTILVLSIVQSVFGIGILVFGTPTLLIFGLDFPSTLSILLPASLSISILQVWQGGRPSVSFIRLFLVWCLTPLILVLVFVLILELKATINLVVSGILAAYVSLRLVPNLQVVVRSWVSRHVRLWLIAMGMVHGASNLGGGLLTILASSIEIGKENTRSLISFCYMIFAFIQILLIYIFNQDLFIKNLLLYPMISSLVYIIIGRRVYVHLSEPVFDRCLTIFMGCYAAVLGARALGLF